MDRISLALKRAKEEHDARGRDAQPQVTSRQASAIDGIQGAHTTGQIYQLSKDILQRNRILCGRESAPVTASYKVLRTQIRQRMKASGWETLGITSPSADQGKTLTSINLALGLAQDLHSSVVLVDLDLRRPSIHQYFGISPEYGISDYFSRGVGVAQISCGLGVDRLILVPGREAIEHASEALASQAAAGLAREVKGGHANRVAIFDLPPILASDDVLAFLPNLDCVLFVIEDGGTTKPDLLRAVDLIGATPLLGTVLNKSSETISQYY